MSDGDRNDIIQLLNLYGLAIDSRRWELFDRLFSPDVVVDYPLGGWSDLASFKLGFEEMHEPFHHTQHAMMNHLVNVSGDAAQAFSYVSWRLLMRDAGGERGQEGSAWYDDELVRTGEGWRIRRRVCNVTWVRPIAFDSAAVAEREGSMHSTQVRDQARAGTTTYLNAIL